MGTASVDYYTPFYLEIPVWDDRALPSPGTAPGLLAAYPSTIQPTRLGLEYLEGETPDVTGVWSNEAFL